MKTITILILFFITINCFSQFGYSYGYVPGLTDSLLDTLTSTYSQLDVDSLLDGKVDTAQFLYNQTFADTFKFNVQSKVHSPVTVTAAKTFKIATTTKIPGATEMYEAIGDGNAAHIIDTTGNYAKKIIVNGIYDYTTGQRNLIVATYLGLWTWVSINQGF